LESRSGEIILNGTTWNLLGAENYTKASSGGRSFNGILQARGPSVLNLTKVSGILFLYLLVQFWGIFLQVN